MTISIQKDALLSEFAVLAYKDIAYLENMDNLPPGWKLVDREINGPFAAFAFRNETTGEVFVSYRGTDGLSDGVADSHILAGKMTNAAQLEKLVAATNAGNIDIFSRYYIGPGANGTLPGSSAIPWQVTQQVTDTALLAYNNFRN